MITIRYDQRVLGRFPGDTETVEQTAFVTALLAQGRVSLVEPAPRRRAAKPAEISPVESEDVDGPIRGE